MIGVEGYVESAAMGLLAAINAVRFLGGRSPITPPPVTAIGSLIGYITDSARRDFARKCRLPENEFFADSFTTAADKAGA